MTDWATLERPLRGPLAACFAIGIATGAGFGWIAGRWSLPYQGIRWLDVMTAFGTVGATFAALGIAWWGFDTQRRGSREVALLVAAEVWLVLTVAASDAKKAGETLQPARQGIDIGPAVVTAALDSIRAARAALSMHELHTLVALPDRCGMFAAAGVGRLAAAEQFILRALRPESHSRKAQCSIAAMFAFEAATFLREVAKIAHRESSPGATHPDIE
jgi:hypothetical protein